MGSPDAPLRRCPHRHLTHHGLPPYVPPLPFLPLFLLTIRPLTAPHADHATDVLAGSLLGLVAAYFSYRQYYPSLAAPYAERPYSPRVPRENRLPVHAVPFGGSQSTDAETERELEAQTVRSDEQGRVVWKDDDEAEQMSLRGNMA